MAQKDRSNSALTARSAAFVGVAAALLGTFFASSASAGYPRQEIVCVRGGGDAMIDIVAENDQTKLLGRVAVSELSALKEVAVNPGAQTGGIPASAPSQWVRLADLVLAPRGQAVKGVRRSGKAASGAQLGGAPADDPCQRN